MKTYIYFGDDGRAYAMSAGSENEARQMVGGLYGVEVGQMVRVEVLPRRPKVIEWEKLMQTSKVTTDETNDEKESEVETAEQ